MLEIASRKVQTLLMVAYNKEQSLVFSAWDPSMEDLTPIDRRRSVASYPA